jgi:hypothetical protein
MLEALMKGSLPRRRSDVNMGIVDGETVVLGRRGYRTHQLNQSATYIWERCDGKTSEAQIARQLAEALDVNPKTATEGVVAMLLPRGQLNLLRV